MDSIEKNKIVQSQEDPRHTSPFPNLGLHKMRRRIMSQYPVITSFVKKATLNKQKYLGQIFVDSGRFLLLLHRGDPKFLEWLRSESGFFSRFVYSGIIPAVLSVVTDNTDGLFLRSVIISDRTWVLDALNANDFS